MKQKLTKEDIELDDMMGRWELIGILDEAISKALHFEPFQFPRLKPEA